MKTASEVREAVKTELDKLGRRFSDMEVFLGTFRGDKSVKDASIELLAAILIAVEYVIKFFVRNRGRFSGCPLRREFEDISFDVLVGIQVLKSLTLGGAYERTLREKIDDIKARSEDLLGTVRNSDISKTHGDLNVLLSSKFRAMKSLLTLVKLCF